MPEDIDTSKRFWEIRYLLTSDRWTARLPRHAAIALPLLIPLLFAYCIILGGPQSLGDYPPEWRSAFILFPPVLAFAIFAPCGHWILKFACYALVMVLACWGTLLRFEYVWEAIGTNAHYAARPPVPVAAPPPDEESMLGCLGNRAWASNRAWATHHATEEHYVKWAVSIDPCAQDRAGFLRWRMPAERQSDIFAEIAS